MRKGKIVRKYGRMMKDLPDNEMMSCIYMLCCELIRRAGNTITMKDIFVSLEGIRQLTQKESEDTEC